MIIIVEGIDRVGKTTLCNMLHKEINLPIYKHVGEFKYNDANNDNWTDNLLQMLEICRLTHSFMIFDRFHLSDYIYGVLQRNYDIKKAKHNFLLIEKFLEKVSRNVILILVLPTNIEKSSKEHGKDLSKHEEMFEELFRQSKIKNKYRVTYNTLSEAVAFVKSTITENFMTGGIR